LTLSFFDDGSIANVEIHKNPYTFAGERVSCYSSDLLLRQYSKLRSQKGKNFRYSDLKQVYTIVIYETTTAEFHRHKPSYIHHGEMIFDTGLKLNMLQHSYLIALDTFRECGYDMSQKETRRELGKRSGTDCKTKGKGMIYHERQGKYNIYPRKK
jgi:hypothetical protein